MPTEKNDVVTFTFDGETYTLPPMKTWPLEAQEYQEEGRDVAAMKLIIGEDGYRRFKAKPRTIGDFEKFIAALFEEVRKAVEATEGE